MILAEEHASHAKKEGNGGWRCPGKLRAKNTPQEVLSWGLSEVLRPVDPMHHVSA